MLILLNRVEKGEEVYTQRVNAELRRIQNMSHKFDVLLEDAVDNRRKDVAAAMMEHITSPNLVQAQARSSNSSSVPELPSLVDALTQFMQTAMQQALDQDDLKRLQRGDLLNSIAALAKQAESAEENAHLIGGRAP